MNSDPRFLRVRVRRLMPALAAAGITPDDLAATAARFAAAADAIDAATDRLIAAAVTVDGFAIARIPADAYRGAPEEIRLRLLVRILMAMGGEPYPPRFQRLKALHDGLARPAGGRFKRTLAGVVAEVRGDSLAFYRESGRAGLPTTAVEPGYAGVWDQRFRVEIGADAPAEIVLGSLGEVGLRAIPARPRHVPVAALAVQPALWRDGELLCAPTLAPPVRIGGEAGRRLPIRVRQIVKDRLAAPPRFPRFADS
jgi:tRNA(Ile)-lysidine synthase